MCVCVCVRESERWTGQSRRPFEANDSVTSLGILDALDKTNYLGICIFPCVHLHRRVTLLQTPPTFHLQKGGEGKEFEPSHFHSGSKTRLIIRKLLRRHEV